jgi:hypothetical protein
MLVQGARDIKSCKKYVQLLKHSLECFHPNTNANTSIQMFRGQYHNAELIVEKVHWCTEDLWVEAFEAKILNPFQVIDEDEEE